MLKKLSHKELDAKLKSLAQKERELLAEVILHIQECDRRKLHLELGYPNLFSYLVEGIGYSAGAAQRRIDAARLSFEIPEVIEKLESGELNLSHVSLVQKASRKNKGDKRKAIQALSKQSFEQSQKIVAEIFDLPKQEELVRVELTLTKEQFEKLQKVKELLSHTVPDGDLTKVLDHMMTHMLTATVAVKPKIKQTILKRDQCCQFKSPITGKVCGSTWQLQVDHIQPKWASGSNDPTNLQVLCGNHNRLKYRKEAGIRWAH